MNLSAVRDLSVVRLGVRLKEVCYLVDGLGIWESVEAVGEGGGFAIGSEGIGYKTPSSNLIGE